MSSDDSKQCSRCKEFKPRTTEYFLADKRHKDKLTSQCRVCHNKAGHKFYHDNIEQERESRKRWKRDNREHCAEYNRAHRKSNPQKYRDYAKGYRLRHPEKVRDGLRKWTNDNRAYVKRKKREYRMLNPEKHRASENRRRTLKRALPATLTPAEWEDIKAEFGYRCAYCTKAWFEIEGVLTQDHVIPLKQGGAYTKDNIVPACFSCNSRKQARTPEQAGMPIVKLS